MANRTNPATLRAPIFVRRLTTAFATGVSKTDPYEPFSAQGTLTPNVANDAEVYAGGPIEENAINPAKTTQDWADPGSNHSP